jgi:hypothetical protein
MLDADDPSALSHGDGFRNMLATVVRPQLIKMRIKFNLKV